VTNSSPCPRRRRGKGKGKGGKEGSKLDKVIYLRLTSISPKSIANKREEVRCACYLSSDPRSIAIRRGWKGKKEGEKRMGADDDAESLSNASDSSMFNYPRIENKRKKKKKRGREGRSHHGTGGGDHLLHPTTWFLTSIRAGGREGEICCATLWATSVSPDAKKRRKGGGKPLKHAVRLLIDPRLLAQRRRGGSGQPSDRTTQERVKRKDQVLIAGGKRVVQGKGGRVRCVPDCVHADHLG